MRRSPAAKARGWMSGFSWDLRIARANELEKIHPAAAELLGFYQSLVRLQKSVYEAMAASADHDVSVLLRHFPALITLIRQKGSPALKEAAMALDAASGEERLALLTGFWQHEVESSDLSPE